MGRFEIIWNCILCFLLCFVKIWLHIVFFIFPKHPVILSLVYNFIFFLTKSNLFFISLIFSHFWLLIIIFKIILNLFHVYFSITDSWTFRGDYIFIIFENMTGGNLQIIRGLLFIYFINFNIFLVSIKGIVECALGFDRFSLTNIIYAYFHILR